MQAKLLRVLEERTFERLGGTETLRMDARLMALTNADLTRAVSAGRFREDLFFRLNVLAIPVPPLRERPADIPPLAAHFLARLGPVHGKSEAALDPAALQLLESYAWPGNVRELKNAIEHALVFGKELLLTPADFPQVVRATGEARGSIGACDRSKTSSAKRSKPRSKPRTTRSAAPPKFWASAARRCSRSARNTACCDGVCARHAFMKIRLVMLGKTRREEIRALLDDYAARIRRYAEIEITELREASPAALRKLKMDPGATSGAARRRRKAVHSQQFARWLGDLRDRGAREVVFLCGDAEGFPAELRSRATQRISLSTLTMPHEFARVVLAEQIYRAFAILAGHPYPK